MKYKFLKNLIGGPCEWYIGCVMDSCTPETELHLSGGTKINIGQLMEMGYLEEVKETLKPRWKIGDYVIRNGSSCSHTRIEKIESMDIASDGECFPNGNGESIYRDLTPEELTLFFK